MRAQRQEVVIDAPLGGDSFVALEAVMLGLLHSSLRSGGSLREEVCIKNNCAKIIFGFL